MKNVNVKRQVLRLPIMLALLLALFGVSSLTRVHASPYYVQCSQIKIVEDITFPDFVDSEGNHLTVSFYTKRDRYNNAYCGQMEAGVVLKYHEVSEASTIQGLLVDYGVNPPQLNAGQVVNVPPNTSSTFEYEAASSPWVGTDCGRVYGRWNIPNILAIQWPKSESTYCPS